MSKEVNQTELKDRDLEELARFAAEIVSDSFASDILLLNISNKSAFTDFMIILTVDSSRQMSAVAEDLEIEMKSKGINKFRKEGAANSGWVVVDFGDIVVHLFGKDEREYYALDDIWSGAQQLLRIQ
ncbi:MAG: ribosome silencing factor [Chloroflexi bacterium]|jgi:ribosome-associated protein|nr:ribosome silencing factor [Chloroflexota bacterium]|tara:strand:- start:113 stop:493 length:381 start_codon:yes stop_codon:yes gene_type:complete